MPRDAFHKELRTIEEAVIQMATLVESEVARSLLALTRRDRALAEAIMTDDDQVNVLERNIRNHAISVIALQAPVARDLRELTSVQLIISELERMGDHAVDIARQALRIREYDPLPLMADVADLAKIVRQQVRGGIQALADENLDAARMVSANDDAVDQLYKALYAKALDAMAREPTTIPAATYLLFVLRDLERIGDRVTNICEHLIYMVTGQIEELN